MPVRRFRSVAARAVLIAGMILLTGCPTPPKPLPRVTQLEEQRPLPLTSLPEPEPAPLEAAPAVVEPAPQVAESAPALEPVPETPAPGPGLNLAAGVLPMSAWMPLCGFTEARVVQKKFPPTYEFHTAGAVIALTAGQRYARWNGFNVALGFPPLLQQGELALNSLDVAKNLYPLLHGRWALPRKDRVLVIDAGHGGRDAGTRGSGNGLIEKDLVLDWALRVEKLLESSPWRVVMTRRDDRELTLQERIAIAETNRADLFISLHFNSIDASPNNKTESGIETYCLTPGGMPSSLIRGYEDDPRKIFPNNAFDTENLILAARMHASMLRATGRRDRGIRRARFMTVLREQNRPAVLLEGGYLSNPAEAALILKADYRQKLARAVCEALPE